jgi:hypothetical protein
LELSALLREHFTPEPASPDADFWQTSLLQQGSTKPSQNGQRSHIRLFPLPQKLEFERALLPDLSCMKPKKS